MLKKVDGKSGAQNTILDRLEKVSWDFDGQRSRSTLSSVHFHPGRFISQLPSILISTLSKEGDTVLDPYCGSGTTLIEAQRLSRNAIGIDINPVSAMITSGKTSNLDLPTIQDSLNNLFISLTKENRKKSPINIPAQVQIEKWYSPSVMSDLSKLYANIIQTEVEDIKNIKWLCFSSVLLKVCNETRHWGYVCDNTAPRDAPPRSVPAQLQNAIDAIQTGFKDQRRYLAEKPILTPKIYNMSAERMGENIAANSVDLVVTSPPYFGVVDYVKSQRLTMEWLGLDIEPFRSLETGARSKRHRQRGSSEFSTELGVTFRNLHTVLRPLGFCAVVFGASKSRAFKTSDLTEIARQQGLELAGEITRQISTQRRMKPSLIDEVLYLFQKPLVD